MTEGVFGDGSANTKPKHWLEQRETAKESKATEVKGTELQEWEEGIVLGEGSRIMHIGSERL